MVKMVLDIEGMSCGMCESHVNDAVRNAFKVKKVSSSHTDRKTEIICEEALDEEKLTKVIDETGYKLLGIHTEPYEKKGLSSLFKK